jgi:O-methyltransferase
MVSTNPVSEPFLDILRAERRDLIERLRKTRFSTLKPGISHSQIIPHASYSPWFDDLAFMALFEAVRSHTLVDIYRCYELHTLAKQLEALPGDFVEIGVWRGGTAALIANALPGKTIHLFDTFAGVAKANKDFDTLYSGGEHADTDELCVKRLFATLSLSCRINTGVFPEETLPQLPGQLSLAHIDVDTYASARDSFSAIWPRILPSGMVIFDDYGFFGCEGVTQCVNEIVAATHNLLFVHNLNGHALLIKKHA